MGLRSRVFAVGLVAGLVVAPAAAQARTKVVTMGVPIKSSAGFAQVGTDVNDFFPHGVTIHVRDKVKFVPAGFHTVDLPAKGGGPAALIVPDGKTVAGVNDAAGTPFWFNGQPELGINPVFLAGSLGKTVSYTGSKEVQSGISLSPTPTSMTVKFKKRGKYRYFCNVHIGMSGLVTVLAKGRHVPNAKADKRKLKNQINRDLNIAKTLSNATQPANVVDVGQAGGHGVEYYGMLPGEITVPAGTTVKFQMTPGSLEDHTAAFGPGNPGDPTQQSTYLGTIAATFQGVTLDPRGVYPSESSATPAILTPLLHGNGFWNTGVMDRAAATPLPDSGSVTFGAPGTYDFYCLIHTNMHGVVHVT